ncbi:hypothetical protein [Desulfuromonas acetoxidans]|uniref:hypothetical protein n=1 Tax=Desulfuromonas acetoxidans TaxID=891 RepID=UPI00292F24FA|nr:hypothetical protein [Desulfuromonas acetoxidans]
MDDKEIQVPEKSSGDIVHSVAKAGLSAIPVLGGTAVELFQNVVQPPLEKRRAEWMAQVGEKLQELEDNGLILEDLQNDEQFISAAMYASQLALRTHKEEKLEALRNAVANIATGQAPDEAMQHIFLNLIDNLTELHIQVLSVFQAPTTPPGLSMGGLSHVLEHNMPQMRGERELCDQLWKDLYTRGLINTDSLHRTMSGNGLGQNRTTSLGAAFLRFISKP